MDNIVCYLNTYPLDSDLPIRWHYPPFEQPAMEDYSTEYLVNTYSLDGDLSFG